MNKHLGNNERGIALIIVLFALLLLTAIASGLLFLTDTETSINSNYRDAQVSYFAARAGMEEVRGRMQTTAPNSLEPFLPVVMPGQPNGVLYVINQDPTDANVVQPWNALSAYGDDQLCHDYGVAGMPPIAGLVPQPPGTRCTTSPVAPGWYVNPPPASTGPLAGTNGALPYKWMRVTWKANQSVNGFSVDGTVPPSLSAGTPVCWNGAAETLLTPPAALCKDMAPAMNPVFMVTSLAVTRTGARRITQFEVTKNIVPPIPSALTLDGDKARTAFGTPNSNNFGISGDDKCSTAMVPAIGTVSDADDDGVTDLLFRPDMFTGQGATPSVDNLNDPPVYPPLLQGMQTVGELKAMIADITSSADAVVTMPAAVPNLGTPGDPSSARITVIKGDFPGPCDGNGVLIITGNAVCSGGTKFDGLMLIVGTGNIQFNGGGNGEINGAILVANLFDNPGLGGLPLPDSSPPGIPTFEWNGGGTNFVQFDTCKILNAFKNAAYRLVAMREVTY
jgi:hypothetical protein